MTGRPMFRARRRVWPAQRKASDQLTTTPGHTSEEGKGMRVNRELADCRVAGVE